MQLFQFAGHAIETNSGTMLLVANSRQPPEDSNTFAVDQVLMSHMNLIVLSACSTGRQWNVNSGLFAALFFHSHIPQVIASRWQIDSHAASAFMNSFYDSLLVGRLPVDSLRYAEHFQRQQQVTSHPYYWSAFMVIGRD
jgi:CHAT domain-containing protein